MSDRLTRYTEIGGDFYHAVGYNYDKLNNLTSLVESIGSTGFVTSYAYDDDNRVTSVTSGSANKAYTYDAFGRSGTQTTKHNTSTVKTDSFTFNNPTPSTTSAQIHTHTIDTNGFDKTYTYTYDDNGNITSVSDGATTTTYVYDSANQLIRENNQAGNFTHVWAYDAGGNIDYRKEYPYTTATTLGTATKTVDYSYDTSTNWKDRLVSYNGKTLTYESTASGKISGNILSDGTWTYNWQKGRQLASMTSGSTTWSFTYNADGLRTKRTNGSTTYNYIYNGDKLSQMTVGNNNLNFAYDASGTPLTVTYNNTVYYYVTNIQGDVIAILNSSGSPVVTYTYDAWGKILSTSGSMASTLGSHNPLRYRSYVYDQESGLYYLQTRYYNPITGRFINADALITTGQGLLGNNMFAYCNNNPVLYSDFSGTIPYADGLLDESFKEAGMLMYEFFTGRTHPDRQTDEINNSIIEEQNKLVGNSIRSSWDTYQSSYIRNQESELRLAQSNVSVKTNSVRNEEAQTLVSVKTNSVRNEEAQT